MCSHSCLKEVPDERKPDSRSLLVEAKPTAESSASVQESQIKMTLRQPVSNESMASESTIYTKEYSVKSKPFVNNLMSHLYDPIYKGNCSCREIRSCESILEKHTHIDDQFYKEKYLCNKVSFFKDSVDKLSEKSCNQNKCKDVSKLCPF